MSRVCRVVFRENRRSRIKPEEHSAAPAISSLFVLDCRAGGAVDQELARIHHSLHTMFHGDLRTALKDAGFPRIGGKGGGTEHWAKFFTDNPAKRDEAIAILKRVTRDFDRKNGTKISKYLDRALADGQAPPPAPQ